MEFFWKLQPIQLDGGSTHSIKNFMVGGERGARVKQLIGLGAAAEDLLDRVDFCPIGRSMTPGHVRCPIGTPIM